MFVYVCVAISHGVHHTRLKSSEVALSVEGKDRRLHQVPFASSSRQSQSSVPSHRLQADSPALDDLSTNIVYCEEIPSTRTGNIWKLLSFEKVFDVII